MAIRDRCIGKRAWLVSADREAALIRIIDWDDTGVFFEPLEPPIDAIFMPWQYVRSLTLITVEKTMKEPPTLRR